MMKVLFKSNDNSKLFLTSYFNRYNPYFKEDKDEIKFGITDDQKRKIKLLINY